VDITTKRLHKETLIISVLSVLLGVMVNEFPVEASP
jgi:hypothetical protein